MPSFVARVERPGRGDVWVDYLSERRAAERRWAERLGLDRDDEAEAALVGAAAARRRRRGPAARRAALRGRRRAGGAHAGRRRARSATTSARGCSPTWSGERANRRHRPGRGFEALRYRFEIVSDYGAFRDLQRHRMLTVQWQRADARPRRRVPEEVVEAGCGDLYERALERSRAEYERLRDAGHAEAAPVRALPRLPDPLHAGPQRPRGDAPDRAALRPRGPRELPRRRAGDARRDRRAPPGGRRGDEARGPLRSEPRPRAHPAPRSAAESRRARLTA